MKIVCLFLRLPLVLVLSFIACSPVVSMQRIFGRRETSVERRSREERAREELENLQKNAVSAQTKLRSIEEALAELERIQRGLEDGKVITREDELVNEGLRVCSQVGTISLYSLQDSWNKVKTFLSQKEARSQNMEKATYQLALAKAQKEVAWLSLQLLRAKREELEKMKMFEERQTHVMKLNRGRYGENVGQAEANIHIYTEDIRAVDLKIREAQSSYSTHESSVMHWESVIANEKRRGGPVGSGGVSGGQTPPKNPILGAVKAAQLGFSGFPDGHK